MDGRLTKDQKVFVVLECYYTNILVAITKPAHLVLRHRLFQMDYLLLLRGWRQVRKLFVLGLRQVPELILRCLGISKSASVED